MKKVWLTIGGRNRYLVGFSTDLRVFFDKYYSCHVKDPSSITWFKDDHDIPYMVQFYHVGQGKSCVLLAHSITDNETCFMTIV